MKPKNFLDKCKNPYILPIVGSIAIGDGAVMVALGH